MPGTRRHFPGLPVQPHVALGRVIRRRREEAGLIQEELAARADVDVTYIRGIEAGRRNPTIQLIWAIAGGLGLSFAEIAAEVQRVVQTAAEADENDG